MAKSQRLEFGAVAQLGERLVCNQEATGSIPVSSTKIVWHAIVWRWASRAASEWKEARADESG
jgi:hypothetical protein